MFFSTWMLCSFHLYTLICFAARIGERGHAEVVLGARKFWGSSDDFKRDFEITTVKSFEA